MKTRHLVSLVTGVLIIAVLVPISLSIWLAHRQAEDKFVDALDSYASRVLIRTARVVDDAKEALNSLQTFKGIPCSVMHLREMRRVAFSWRYVHGQFLIQLFEPTRGHPIPSWHLYLTKKNIAYVHQRDI